MSKGWKIALIVLIVLIIVSVVIYMQAKKAKDEDDAKIKQKETMTIDSLKGKIKDLGVKTGTVEFKAPSIQAA